MNEVNVIAVAIYDQTNGVCEVKDLGMPEDYRDMLDSLNEGTTAHGQTVKGEEQGDYCISLTLVTDHDFHHVYIDLLCYGYDSDSEERLFDFSVNAHNNDGMSPTEWAASVTASLQWFENWVKENDLQVSGTN